MGEVVARQLSTLTGRPWDWGRVEGGQESGLECGSEVSERGGQWVAWD